MVSPFMGEYLFFDGQRKGTKRKATRMLALRVPCDAQISWRGVNSWCGTPYPLHHTGSNMHTPKPQLILRFSASLNGTGRSKPKVKTSNYSMPYCRSTASARFFFHEVLKNSQQSRRAALLHHSVFDFGFSL